MDSTLGIARDIPPSWLPKTAKVAFIPLKQFIARVCEMKPLLRGVISLVLIGGIFWKLGGIGEVGGLIAKAGPAYLMLLIVGTTLDRLFTTFKWTWLLNGRGVHLPLLLGMKIYCASM